MEKLGDYLPTHRRGMLGRIYLARQLGEKIQNFLPDPIKVIVRGQLILLMASSPSQAKRLSLERRKIEAILTHLAGSRHGLTVKIRLQN